MVRTGNIVDELFARSQGGVFACRNRTGKVQVRYKRKAPWSMTLGLAGRLEAAVADDQVLYRSPPDPAKLIARCEQVESNDLELATTDALLAELYFRKQGHWILGLSRPRRHQGEWTALCRKGDKLACAGLASILVGAILLEDYACMLRRMPPREKIMALFAKVMKHLDTESRPSRTWMAGITRMAEDVICNMPGPNATPGDDLKAFVSID